MNRPKLFLLVLLTLVASLALASGAGAKTTRAAKPDLVVKKVSKPPKTGVVGSKLKLVVKVKNTGGAKAGKSRLGLYLGKGKKHRKKDKRLKRVKVKPLAAGKSKKLKLRVTLPAKSTLGSYRLFACADDTKKVKEATERNCKSTRKISLVAKPVPVPPPAAAFTMSDGLDWGFVEDAQEENPKPGNPITLNLTAGNGIPGQAGYTRSNVGGEGFRTGSATTLDFGSNEDDGQATLQLPFAFPFGGVSESTISVSTNGWVSFGSPAWDYWDDVQPTDYRGIQAVVGELERGIMPYWADLDIGEPNDGDGSVKKVVAADNSWVAFQWQVAQHGGGGDPRRNFQLVLFPDGKFRFDYPGENLPGGNSSFVGYSLGTGAASADVVSAEGDTVPSGSMQFMPNAVPAAGPTASGEITALLPKGSSFVSAGAGCTLATAPGKFTTGLVSCAVPSIGAGVQFSQTVTFAMPGNAPGESSVANFRLLGTYLSGVLKLTDGDEVDDLTTSLEATSIDIEPEYTGGNIEAGVQTSFAVKIKAVDSSGLDEPSAKFTISNATLSAIEIDGDPIECTALGGSTATCLLPSGTSGTTVDLTVVPAKVEPIELTTTAQALNAGAATQAFGVAP
jgi:hypothetical protein